MILRIIRQTVCQARRQWEMSLVSLFGTAFAIFLVMVVVVVNRVDHAPFPPVSDRARLLYARGVDIYFGNGSRSAAYSPAFAREIYAGLPGSDAMAMYSWLDECDAAVRGSGAFDVNLRSVGGDYWKIFDFRFLAGAPFRPAAENRKYDAATPVVISESVARRLFGSAGDDVVGREVLISHAPRKVCGVVAEVTPLADMAYSQVWIPFEGPVATAVPVDFNDFYGECQAVVRIAPGSSLSAVKAEAGRRYEAAARRLAAGGYELNTHFQPHTLAEFKSVYGTNSDPAEQTQWRTWLVYAILLIVPAINLSGMTHSFLRRRRTELGVRRAFGSTRGRIIMDVFAENLLVTLAGSIIGLVAAWIFLWLFVDSFVAVKTWETVFASVTVAPAMLFSWSVFGYAVLFCLVLNTLSVGVPAFSAARMNPVEAISGRDD
ncbi:MAG: ABC transporter permease [Muribaculaceae bacterium]|nr:ABC transporter permease [Muribaculaceae bacterium]